MARWWKASYKLDFNLSTFKLKRMYDASSFLSDEFYPPWSRLEVQAIPQAVDSAIQQSQAKLDRIGEVKDGEENFDNTLWALERATDALDRVWRKVAHLNGVADSPELRRAYGEVLPRVSAFQSAICLDESLWKKLKNFSKSQEAKNLPPVSKRLLEENLKDFKESGADLKSKDKARLKRLNENLAKLCKDFSEHVLDAVKAFRLVVEDEGELDGLPDSVKQSLRAAALAKGYGSEEKPAWLITLQAPSLVPVMTYAHSECLRKKLWRANCEIGRKGSYDNTELVKDILQLRYQRARLLGYAHPADKQTERRMARTGAQALSFVEALKEHVFNQALEERKTLENFRAEHLGLETPEKLEAWQVAYWSERCRKAHLGFDEEVLKAYLPLPQVCQGLFQLCETVFSLRICQRSTFFIDPQKRRINRLVQGGKEAVEVWDSLVSAYDLLDKDGTLLGSFFLDLYPRDNKCSGAWLNPYYSSEAKEGETLPPHLGIICCNFTSPVEGEPPLLTHREVETLFHEFGHCLHHLLGRVAFATLNGTHVAWDFVELPSQFMENWCWQRESLDLFALKGPRKEKLSDTLFKQLLGTRCFLPASSLMSQLAIGKLDLDLHMNYPKGIEDLDKTCEDILKDYQLPLQTKPPPFAQSLGHLFSSDGYSAGYYSYQWAVVLEADAFGRFLEEGILNPKTGRSFRENILEKGNSCPPSELFETFRGRAADTEASLRRVGLA